jgi:hypothetical protein
LPLPRSHDGSQLLYCRPRRVVRTRGETESSPSRGYRRFGAGLDVRPALRSEAVLEIVLGLETTRSAKPKDVLEVAAPVDGHRPAGLNAFLRAFKTFPLVHRTTARVRSSGSLHDRRSEQPRCRGAPGGPSRPDLPRLHAGDLRGTTPLRPAAPCRTSAGTRARYAWSRTARRVRRKSPGSYSPKRATQLRPRSSSTKFE